MTPKRCIYCGQEVGRVKKGEHVIPKAIGGSLSIRSVCRACNNRFSVLDDELCSRSPLSIVASQVLDARLWQAWDVDHASKNLLLEAQHNWMAQCARQYPQVVFESAGPQVRGDYLEMLHFGREDFVRVLVRAMLGAFRQHEAGEKRRFHFDRLETRPAVTRGYRFPPRVFARHSIGEIAVRLASGKPAAFVLRYLTEPDRRFALNALDNWSPGATFPTSEITMGSRMPPLGCCYDPPIVQRALAKIAVNVLAKHCPNTPVNKDYFPAVFRIIVADTLAVPEDWGFVWASDIQGIKDANGGHSFRLLHMDRHWRVYMSFFGGKIGAFVRFPGPNNERWSCADILAPLRSEKWTVASSPILQPLRARVEWKDAARLMPSAEIFNLETVLHRIPC